MARYNFWYINGGEGIVVKDYEKNKQLTPQELCDLLNAHDGMMTRKDLQKEIDFLGDDCTGQDRAVKQAYQSVLNGGTK